MIRGKVIMGVEATIPVVLVDDHGVPWEIDAVIDTGFNSTMTLPHEAIEAIGLRSLRRETARLADSQIVETDVFEGRLLWNGEQVLVEISELEQIPLVGMSLLQNQRLVMDIIDGGDVTVTPISSAT